MILKELLKNLQVDCLSHLFNEFVDGQLVKVNCFEDVAVFHGDVEGHPCSNCNLSIYGSSFINVTFNP